LVISESDQPDTPFWEKYSLDGFSGETITIMSYRDTPPDILAALRPTCPQCGETGKVQYATKR
jgi:hypothetical protein